MKKTIIFYIIILTLLIVGNVFAAPRLKLNDEVWDMGTVHQGETKERAFVIKNTGTSELVIDKVKTCCGYLLADISSFNIQPGEKATIKILCDTDRKSLGSDEKTIRIYSNDPKNPKRKVPVIIDIVKTLVPEISVDELNQMLAEKDKVIMLDVREEFEYQIEYIDRAKHYPRSKFIGDLDEIKELVGAPKRDTKVVVHCGSGIRSSYIARKLRDDGYDAYNLAGGLKAWKKKGFSLIVNPAADGKPPKQPIIVNLEEAYEHYYKEFKDKTAWIDLRSEEDFALAHIPGAINVPFNRLRERIFRIPMNKGVVLYCESAACDKSEAAAKALFNFGFNYPKIKVLQEGIEGWDKANYPLTDK